jgi:nonsense-mediated mRNA decay protein 3
MNIMELETMQNMKKQVPPVVLVKKTYPKFRKRQKNRLWKIKHLDKEAIDENNIHHKKEKTYNKAKRDYDLFLQDIEEDPDVRQNIDLFKNDEIVKEIEKKFAEIDLEESKKVQDSTEPTQEESKDAKK